MTTGRSSRSLVALAAVAGLILACSDPGAEATGDHIDGSATSGSDPATAEEPDVDLDHAACEDLARTRSALEHPEAEQRFPQLVEQLAAVERLDQRFPEQRFDVAAEALHGYLTVFEDVGGDRETPAGEDPFTSNDVDIVEYLEAVGAAKVAYQRSLVTPLTSPAFARGAEASCGQQDRAPLDRPPRPVVDLDEVAIDEGGHAVQRFLDAFAESDDLFAGCRRLVFGDDENEGRAWGTGYWSRGDAAELYCSIRRDGENVASVAVTGGTVEADASWTTGGRPVVGAWRPAVDREAAEAGDEDIPPEDDVPLARRSVRWSEEHDLALIVTVTLDHEESFELFQARVTR